MPCILLVYIIKTLYLETLMSSCSTQSDNLNFKVDDPVQLVSIEVATVARCGMTTPHSCITVIWWSWCEANMPAISNVVQSGADYYCS